MFINPENMEVAELLLSDIWINADNDCQKYLTSVQTTLKEPTGKAKTAAFEQLDKHLYAPGARMLAFRTSSDRIVSWIKALALRYHSQFGELTDHTVTWTDKTMDEDTEGQPVEIMIQLFRNTSDPESKENSSRSMSTLEPV